MPLSQPACAPNLRWDFSQLVFLRDSLSISLSVSLSVSLSILNDTGLDPGLWRKFPAHLKFLARNLKVDSCGKSRGCFAGTRSKDINESGDFSSTNDLKKEQKNSHNP